MVLISELRESRVTYGSEDSGDLSLRDACLGKPISMNKRSFTPSNFDSRCNGDNGKGMKGRHEEGTQKQKVRKVHFAALMDIRHRQKYEYIPETATKTISSVDMSTSTSRGTFARAISSVENSSQAADVKGEKHSQPIHHRRAVHELREEIDEARIRAEILNRNNH